ncbi:hypothetical protein BG015_002105 [Linnemannia schmuckeri]|uniref:Uncharacterized protein n=1 Tax=Linnemannia schmuckeri TaxID=64567 RepID=A0A9P5S3L2_9FUNG|nr:hypothetical protein BG015_002105 [Linnemannia schmuckeri]
MPVADTIPMSSEVARSGSPPAPRIVDTDNQNNNDNNDDVADRGQEEMDSIQTTTLTAATVTAAATQQGNHHYREQDQGRLNSEADDDEIVEEDEHENEDDVDWGDDEDDDVYEEEPDPVYVADLLRQSRIDWMQYPEYATHRLVVTSTAETTGAEGQVPGRQYYQVMAQFLIPGSAVFRDFLLGEDSSTATSNEDEEEEQKFRRERLACLHDGPFTDSTLANNTQLQDPSNAPNIAHSVLEALEPYIDQRSAPYTPFNLSQETTDNTETDPYAHQPWIHLSLDHPEHFPGLLQAVYTMDLEIWEETCFRPETIVGIIETVRRLECCSGLMVKCLEYFRKVEDILGVEGFEKQDGREGERGLEEVRRLLRAAVDGGMLPLDPEF